MSETPAPSPFSTPFTPDTSLIHTFAGSPSPNTSIEMDFVYTIPDVTINRKEEKRQIKTLNERLRSILDVAQLENAELDSKLKIMKTRNGEFEQQRQELENRIKEARQNLMKKKNEKVVVEIENIKLEQNLQDIKVQLTRSKELEEEHVNSLKQMIEARTAQLTSIKSQLESLQAQNKELEALNAQLLQRREQAFKVLEEIQHTNINLQTESDKFDLELRLREAERNRLQGQLHKFENKDVETYYKEEFQQRVQKGIQELEMKYTKMFEEKKNEIQDFYDKKLNQLKEKYEHDMGLRKQLTSECDQLRENIKSLQETLKNFQEKVSNFEHQIAEKERQIKKMNEDIQAAIIMKTNVDQEKILLQKKVKDTKESIAKQEEAQNKYQLQLNGHKNKHLQQMAALDAQIEQMRAKLSFLQGQLADANVHLDPEIMKYRGLVEVAEYKLSPEKPRKKARIAPESQ